MKKIIKVNYLYQILFLLFAVTVFSQTRNKFVVILDAGHGGKDPGNSYHGFVEKEIALKTTLKIEKYLQKDPDIQVIFTRKSDVFIQLKERPKKANSIDADLFVSIHCNSVNNPEPSGTETFVMGLARSKGNLEIAKQENSVILLEKDYQRTYKGFDPKKPETLIGLKILQEDYLDRSIGLASKIENNFVKKLNRKSRGIKQTPLWVLDAAYMPSVLIELGFLSNKKEGLYLNSEAGQSDMAEAIALAILTYKKEFFEFNTTNESKPINKAVVKKIQNKELTRKSNGDNTDNSAVDTSIIFKIQFAAGTTNLKLNPQNFKGLKDVAVTTIDGKWYNYIFGNAKTYHEAKENLKIVQSKGYNEAYIIAFKNGKKISVKEALK